MDILGTKGRACDNLPSRPYPSTMSLAESLWQTGPPYLPIHINGASHLWSSLRGCCTLIWRDVDVFKQPSGVDGGNVSLGLLQVVNLACMHIV